MLNFREVEWLPQSPTATSWLSWLAGGGGQWGGVHMCLTYELECLAAKPTPWLPLSVIVTKLFLMTFLSKSPLLEIVKDSTNYLLPLEIFLDSFFFLKTTRGFCHICHPFKLLRSTSPIRLLPHSCDMKSTTPNKWLPWASPVMLHFTFTLLCILHLTLKDCV